MLLKRTKKPRPAAPSGFTDERGFKTPDAPRNWPFGMKPRPIIRAQPRIKRAAVESDEETILKGFL